MSAHDDPKPEAATNESATSELPAVTVVVVTYNEAENIAACLESLLALRYPTEKLDILVVDGASSDATARIVQEIAVRHPHVRLLDNPGRTIASNRNVGVQAARHGLLAFTDADCRVAPDWLRTLTDAFRQLRAEQPDLVAVGGGNVPPAGERSDFLDALGLMLDTFLGSLGSVQGRRPTRPVVVPSLACLNVLYDRDAVRNAGGFDVGMANMGEDAELNHRLGLRGGVLMFVPGADVAHRLRGTPAAWFANMVGYGRGRVRLFRKHRALLTPTYALPLGFLAAFAVVPLAPLVGPWALLPLTYVPGLAAYSGWLAVRAGRPALAGRVFLAFSLTHWGYALGMAAELLQGGAQTAVVEPA